MNTLNKNTIASLTTLAFLPGLQSTRRILLAFGAFFRFDLRMTSRSSILKGALLVALAVVVNQSASASTWKRTPVSSDWNTAGNWTRPSRVPNGAGSHAVFDISNLTNVAINEYTLVGGITFLATATNPFTITITPGTVSAYNNLLAISQDGIINDSGVTHNFVVQGNALGYYGDIIFQDATTAGQQMSFTTFGGIVADGSGGTIDFTNTTSATDGIFVNNGPSAAGAEPGETAFVDSSTAASATLIANAGENGNDGGQVSFWDTSTGGTARVELFGNGNLEMSGHDLPGITLGSIEGDGEVFLGANILTVGANDLATTFAGVIQDGGFAGGTGGSLTKVGAGTLTLSNANTYTGGTTLAGGFLLVGNTSASGTGRGAVQVTAGTLGGDGTISGSVTIGTGSGTGAGLGPGKNSVTPGTLTIGGKLKLMRDATYKVTLDSTQVTADDVNSRGVTIRGAQISLLDRSTSVLLPGTAFTIINNTSASPISGTFSNLGDGATIIAGNNTFQANYEGGDGNDLTLTVIP